MNITMSCLMQIFKNTFKEINFQENININNLKIVPIQIDSLKHDDRIVPFDELYDKGLAKAEEVSDEGIVSQVKIINDSENLLFITDDNIIGAKQNRIAERSVTSRINLMRWCPYIVLSEVVGDIEGGECSFFRVIFHFHQEPEIRRLNF